MFSQRELTNERRLTTEEAAQELYKWLNVYNSGVIVNDTSQWPKASQFECYPRCRFWGRQIGYHT